MGFYQKLQKNTPDEPELWAQDVSVASFTKQLLHTCLAESSPASQLYCLFGNQLCASGMSIKALLSLLDLSILGAFLSRCVIPVFTPLCGGSLDNISGCSESPNPPLLRGKLFRNANGLLLGFSSPFERCFPGGKESIKEIC